jgi:hypothetical protein
MEPTTSSLLAHKETPTGVQANLMVTAAENSVSISTTLAIDAGMILDVLMLTSTSVEWVFARESRPSSATLIKPTSTSVKALP